MTWRSFCLTCILNLRKFWVEIWCAHSGIIHYGEWEVKRWVLCKEMNKEMLSLKIFQKGKWMSNINRLKFPKTMNSNFAKQKVQFWYLMLIFIKLDEDECMNLKILILCINLFFKKNHDMLLLELQISKAWHSL